MYGISIHVYVSIYNHLRFLYALLWMGMHVNVIMHSSLIITVSALLDINNHLAIGYQFPILTAIFYHSFSWEVELITDFACMISKVSSLCWWRFNNLALCCVNKQVTVDKLYGDLVISGLGLHSLQRPNTQEQQGNGRWPEKQTGGKRGQDQGLGDSTDRGLSSPPKSILKGPVLARGSAGRGQSQGKPVFWLLYDIFSISVATRSSDVRECEWVYLIFHIYNL